MMAGFPELMLGGVLVAPFVTYALVAALLLLLLCPLLRLVRFELVFENPPLVLLCLYVILLALLFVLV